MSRERLDLIAGFAVCENMSNIFVEGKLRKLLRLNFSA